MSRDLDKAGRSARRRVCPGIWTGCQIPRHRDGRLRSRLQWETAGTSDGAIGHLVPALVTLGLGFVLHEYLAVALIIGLLVAVVFQSVLFQIIARTQNEVLRPWRATVIAIIIVAGDFLIASPIVELLQHGAPSLTPKT